MEIVIINEALFKENSPIKDDTIIAKFVPYISLAQKMYIRDILGVKLLEELQNEVKAASVTPVPDPYPISPNNQALILEIAPALSFYAVYQGLPFHWAAIVNKGVTLGKSENSETISINDLSQLRRWIKDDADKCARELVKYLCNCKTSYPLWAPGPGYGCGEGCEKKTISPFDAGIHIPKRKRR